MKADLWRLTSSAFAILGPLIIFAGCALSAQKKPASFAKRKEESAKPRTSDLSVATAAQKGFSSDRGMLITITEEEIDASSRQRVEGDRTSLQSILDSVNGSLAHLGAESPDYVPVFHYYTSEFSKIANSQPYFHSLIEFTLRGYPPVPPTAIAIADYEKRLKEEEERRRAEEDRRRAEEQRLQMLAQLQQQIQETKAARIAAENARAAAEAAQLEMARQRAAAINAANAAARAERAARDAERAARGW